MRTTKKYPGDVTNPLGGNPRTSPKKRAFYTNGNTTLGTQKPKGGIGSCNTTPPPRPPGESSNSRPREGAFRRSPLAELDGDATEGGRMALARATRRGQQTANKSLEKATAQRLPRYVSFLVALRSALLTSLQAKHDAPPSFYLATSPETLWLCGVECSREDTFGVGPRTEWSNLVLLTRPVDERGCLVDAKVVQVEQRANELGAFVEGNSERPPQNAPSLHEDAERLLYLHSKLAQVEVKRVVVGGKAFAGVWRQELVAEGVGRIPQDVVVGRQLVDSLRHLTACVRRPIVTRTWRCARHAQESVLRRSDSLNVQAIAALRSGEVPNDVQDVVD